MKKYVYFFSVVILINLILFGLGVIDIFDSWPLYQIPLFQIGWLYEVARTIELPVEGRANEMAVLPNVFGWVLISIGSLITIFIYGLIARTIFNRQKTR